MVWKRLNPVPEGEPFFACEIRLLFLAEKNYLAKMAEPGVDGYKVFLERFANDHHAAFARF